MSKLKCYLNLLIMYCPIISNRENWQLFFTFNQYFAFKYSFRQQIPNCSFSPLNENYPYLWLYSFFSSELFELLMCSFLDGSKGSSEEVTILQLRFHVWGTKQNYYLASPVSYTSFTYPSMMCNALLYSSMTPLIDVWFMICWGLSSDSLILSCYLINSCKTSISVFMHLKLQSKSRRL